MFRITASVNSITTLKEYGMSIPDDIRLISLTGHSIGSMLETTMSSMEIPAHEMGEKAARMIITELIRKKKRRVSRSIWYANL